MSKRILIIEDEPITVESLTNWLTERSGYTVDLIDDLTKGIQLLSINKYDLLILDIMLPHDGIIGDDVSPKESGIAFLKMLREGKIENYDLSQNLNIPIVILTAIVNPLSMRAIRELQPETILRKPVVYKEFYKSIQKALKIG